MKNIFDVFTEGVGEKYMAKIADKVFELIKDTVENQGVELYDVTFVKEGASHYLRVFIDKPEGVDINDCTNVSHAIDSIIDKADPIDMSYYLEVSSPGINRELKRENHFLRSIGKNVTVKLYKPLNGTKTLFGVLVDYDNGPTVETEDGQQYKFLNSEIVKVTLNEMI